MLNNINTVFYTVTFILPGFIISYIKSKFVPIRIIHTSEYIFRYFFYSAINMFISIPGLYYIKTNNTLNSHPYIVIFGWLGVVTIVPVILGIIHGIISLKEWDKLILNKICPSTIKSAPTAWDYKFNSLTEGRHIIVKLKDGSIIYGLYSTKSYASGIQDERDLYIEEIFDVEGDSLSIIPDSDGVLIKSDQISMIEFRKIDLNEDSKVSTYEELKNIKESIDDIYKLLKSQKYENKGE